MSAMTTQEQEGAATAINPNALFLVGMHYPNMFEERRDEHNRPAGYRCKVCDETVGFAERKEHHERHKADRAHYATEQIRARKEQDMTKEKTPTPREQGIPDVYLNADGTKFIPGADATYKSDAFKTILYHEHGYTDIDLSTRRADLKLEDVKRIVSERGWNGLFIKTLKNRETQDARKLAKAAEKAGKVKDEVAAKREQKGDIRDKSSTVAKPDPKPARRQRARRKVGA